MLQSTVCAVGYISYNHASSGKQSFLVRWNAEQQLLYFDQRRPPCPKERNCKQFEEVLTSSSSFLSSPTCFSPSHLSEEKPQRVGRITISCSQLAPLYLISSEKACWSRWVHHFFVNWNLRDNEKPKMNQTQGRTGKYVSGGKMNLVVKNKKTARALWKHWP